MGVSQTLLCSAGLCCVISVYPLSLSGHLFLPAKGQAQPSVRYFARMAQSIWYNVWPPKFYQCFTFHRVPM